MQNLLKSSITDDLSKELHTTLAREAGVKCNDIICIPTEHSAALESCQSALLDRKPSFLVTVDRSEINKMIYIK